MNQSILHFWWIDDMPQRVEMELVKKRIEQPRHPGLKHKRAKLLIHKIDNGNWMAVVDALAASSLENQPDLIIVDQRLGQHKQSKQLGSSLAPELRAQRANIPILLASAEPHVLSQQRTEGIDFIKVESLQSGDRVPDLFAIADGFQQVIRSRTSKSKSDQRITILDLVACPEHERDTFLHCLPQDFLKTWDDETPHQFARWIWNQLIGRTGFLMDDLAVATMIGLDPSALKRIAKILDPCQYKGCFASVARPRWWTHLVRSAIRSATGGAPSDPLYTLGRQLVPNRRALHSRAYGHTDHTVIPDCVAFIDGRLEERKAAVLTETSTVPYELPEPGFDPIRIYEGSKR